MKWLYVNSVNELKSYGTMKEVRKLIKQDLEKYFNGRNSREKNIVEMIKITSASWAGLYDKICALRNFMSTLNNKEKLNVETNKKGGKEIEYFKTEADEIIFYLLVMNGKSRSEKLGITRDCFIDENVAKAWRNSICKKIHPDKTNNKYATEAAAKLNQLYKEMIGNA